MARQKSSKKTIQFVYNVTGGDSGAIATHTLGVLPGGAVITGAFIDVQTTFTSATDAGTIALGVTGTAGLFDTAIAISDGTNPWDAGKRPADEPTNQDVAAPGPAQIADFHVVASGVYVIATVAVEVLTAGKLELIVEYYIP